ncbi:MAG: sigma 54-interacting transcriptional regulator [Acidobacteriota bacterium]
MGTRALQCVAGANAVVVSRAELETDSVQAFAGVKEQEGPVAYLVRNEDLPLLRSFKDLVVDRGSKHEARPLSKLLLRCSKMPVVLGGFSASGQLKRSVRRVLHNATKANDRNVYLVGVERAIFEELWDEARPEAGAGATATPQGAVRSRAAEAALTPQATTSARTLLELLPRTEVPAELEKRFVGRSIEAQVVHRLVMHAARSGHPVLIIGDTGTGKEVVARCIHDYSNRTGFTPVNCGAIPSELLETVLFGNKGRVFTGADRERNGLWKEAGKGTLFLDEIADLRLDHQVKILRAIETKKIRPLGARDEIDVPARVIVASNRDLFSLVQSGLFREDLYYRLRTFMIRTPSLRDCAEDIPLIADFLWKRVTGDERAALPEPILAELGSHGWPGNVRELKAILANLNSLFGKDRLRVDHLRATIGLQGSRPARGAGEDEIGLHRVQCLRHLKRVDEVVRASKVALRPLVEPKRQDPESIASVRVALRHRLDELEVLCMHPLLFSSEVAFSIVHRLKGKLAYYDSLLETGATNALRYWRREAAEEYKLAVSTLFQEVNRLTKM